MVIKDILSTLEKVSAPIVEKHNYELVEIEFIKEAGNWFLRVYIDKPDGITLDDCQIVSIELGKIFDEMDLITQSYFLEVSSPGLERPLKRNSDFEKCIGLEVEVKLIKPIDGKKKYTGILQSFSTDRIVIGNSTEGVNCVKDVNCVKEKMEFERVKVALVKRVIRF